MMQDYLTDIEINVVGKEYSFVTFHFHHLSDTKADLKKQEVKIFSFCRDLLDDVFQLIKILGGADVPSINKLVRPSAKYGETYDKEHRYLEVMFTLGKLHLANAQFDKFCCKLILRELDSLHVIDNGRFEFEFQALKDHHRYINIVEGFHTDELKESLNLQLNDIVVPIGKIISKLINVKIPGIHLSLFEPVEYGHMEGEAILSSDAIILGSTAD